ncbi:MAG: hypothetical protein JWN99_2390, partial [Ilumatobacteraceae bacterium]|nr:hypothetical protein [Ilumatobacteraceae bacterium]
TDSFSYQVTDATGLVATGTADITVDSGTSTGGLYLGTTSTVGIWNMTVAPAGNATPEPDHDGDGDPGITVHKDGGFNAETWTRTIAGTALDLNGPVTLELWSTIENFKTNKDGHPDVTLLDCNALGTGCLTVAHTSTHMRDYNGNVANWVRVDVELGNVTHTFAIGRRLRLLVDAKHEDLWIAATGSRPSRLTYTIANAAPIAADDTAPVSIEDAPTPTHIAVLANDADNNLDSASLAVTTPPTKGVATPQPDGTIDYQPIADANGADSFIYRVCDTSGLCDTATVSINITAVNDAPSFSPGADITLNATDPPYAQAGWATGIVAGPTNEGSQTVTFTVAAADPSLFTVQPALSATGTLTFIPSGSTGTTTITIQLTDNGGTANGGSNASSTLTASITVN